MKNRSKGGLEKSSFWFKHLIILGWSNILTRDFNSLLAPTKSVSFSDRITCTFPRLDISLQRNSINALDDKHLANSIWTAFVVKHVNSNLCSIRVWSCYFFHFNMIWTKVIYTGVKKRLISNAYSFFGTSLIRLLWSVARTFLHVTQFY